MNRPFIELAIGRWLEGYSVYPIIPHIVRLYEGFDYKTYEKRQPTIHEMVSWSHEEKFRGAGVGIAVNYQRDKEKTMEIIREMGDLDEINNVPVFILAMLKNAIANQE